MAKPRKAWDIHPAKKRMAVAASIKVEVEAKAKNLIETVLKPKYVLPPKKDEQFNHITDIGAKWHGIYFYFFSIYACPGPDAISPSFDSKFARMEPIGSDRFALYSMHYTGKEWVGVYDALSIDECMTAIKDDPWFVP